MGGQAYGQTVEKTHLSTDRTIYAPEDTVWFKAYVFDRANFLSDQSVTLKLLINNTVGEKLLDRSLPIVQGMSQGYFVAPKEEGKYNIVAVSGQMVDSENELAFSKDIYVRSALVDEVILSAFQRESTGQELNVEVFSQENTNRTPSPDLRFKYELWSDEGLLDTGRGRTDDNGEAKLALEKPLGKRGLKLHLVSNENNLNKEVKYTLPLESLVQEIDLQFFPEGGALMEGTRSRVAFKATDAQGSPFDFSAVIFDEKEQPLDTIKSYYEGMGSFEFTADFGIGGFLKVISPMMGEKRYTLPQASQEGVAMFVEYSEQGSAMVKLTASEQFIGKASRLEVSQFDSILVAQEFTMPLKKYFKIPRGLLWPGVARITLYGQNGEPLSERLVFWEQDEKLNIEVSTDKKQYSPREKVTAQIKVTDSNGSPVSGNFSFAAIDLDRSKSPGDEQANLLANILLSSELKGNIPTPNFYFTNDPKAKNALDLVMLTNGWRRFVPGRQKDPEGISGTVLRNNNKRKRLIEKPITITSFDGYPILEVSTDTLGAFYIPSSYLKNKGDSFLLTSLTDNRKDRFSIMLNDTARLAGIDYFKSIAQQYANGNPNQGIALFEPNYKLAEDRFNGMLLLNTVEVTKNGYRDPDECELQDYHFEKPWVTKFAEEIDMSEGYIINWVRQVSRRVMGYGNVEATTRVGRIIAGEDAILSSFRLGPFYIPFSVYLNCDQIPIIPGGGIPADYQITKTFEAIDFSNLESISIRESSSILVNQKGPIIRINTIENKILFKPVFQKYRFITAYKEYDREFYSPMYDTPEKLNDPIPDLRNTIFWQASVFTNEEGKAELSYYNADRTNTIEITVEGISLGNQLGNNKVTYEVGN